MLFFIKSMLICVIGLVLINDILFNKRRKKLLKLLECIVSIVLVYYLFVSTTNYIVQKNHIKQAIQNDTIFGEPMTEYDIDGTVKTSTIGEYLYNHFIDDAFDGNTSISKSEYLKNNIIIVVMTCIIFIYWLVLLLLFEKEEITGYQIVEDEILFEKYNPMMAACISQNRNVMCRDVIGVLLNLIQKDKIHLRIVPDKDAKDVGYRYMISENPESQIRLDMIEKEIYDWIFEEIPEYEKGKIECQYICKSEEGILEIDFVKRMQEIEENTDTYARLKEINHQVSTRLHRIGANKESVPFLLKLWNNILMFISVILVSYHIMKNGMDIVITDLQVLYIMFIMIFAISILPVIYIFSLVSMQFLRILLRVVTQITEGYTGRVLIAKSVSIIFATCVLILIYATFAKDLYMIYDILLLGVTCLVIFTDDYMLKHEPQILNDYYNLKRIENQLEQYSLMKNENIEYIKLWETYYPYAVAFGIPNPVNDDIGSIYDAGNTAIITQQNLEAIYYVCKSYLEVMWDMEFYDKHSKMNILKIIE